MEDDISELVHLLFSVGNNITKLINKQFFTDNRFSITILHVKEYERDIKNHGSNLEIMEEMYQIQLKRNNTK